MALVFVFILCYSILCVPCYWSLLLCFSSLSTSPDVGWEELLRNELLCVKSMGRKTFNSVRQSTFT